MRLSPPGTHFTAESTEAMWIKCLAQGNNILLPGFELSTSVSKTDILANRPICSNAYENCLKIFYSYYNTCFSVIAKTTKSNRPRKDWCTLDIAKSCKTKCKLYKTSIRKPTSVNKQNYITFRNKLSQTIRNAKQTYYSNLFY